MSRHLFLLCYDITDPIRLRHVRSLLQAWRVGGQYSAVECWLTTHELATLKEQLATMIDPTVDKVHLVRLDPRQPVLQIGSRDNSAFQPDNGAFFVH